MRVDRRDEAIVVFDGELQSLAHVVVARPEEGVTDAGVVDEQPAEARLQIGVARHFTDDLVEAVVLQHHGEGVAADTGAAEALLRILKIRQAAAA